MLEKYCVTAKLSVSEEGFRSTKLFMLISYLGYY
jgi:hypothetical protein